MLYITIGIPWVDYWGDTCLIIRSYLERITHVCRENGKTLIILHDINKKGEIAGSNAFKAVLDTVLLLKKQKSGLIQITVEKARFLHECESCLVKKIRVCSR